MFKKGHKHSKAWYKAVSKPRPQHVKDAVSKAQKGRKHKPQEGFSKGHPVYKDTKKTRFTKGKAPWNKGKGKGTNPVKLKFQTYKSNAKKRGFSFDLTLEEFRSFLIANCFYCGDPSTGIDRLDCSLGYVVGNMTPCCGTCNRMKWVLTREQFLERCHKITENCGVVGYEV